MAKPPRQKHSPSSVTPMTIDAEAEKPRESEDSLSTPGADAPVPAAGDGPSQAAPFEEAEMSAEPAPGGTAQQPPPRMAARPRTGSGLLAGLAGGALALLLGAAGQWSGILPSPGAAPVDAVSPSAFATLQQRVDTLAAATENGAAATAPALSELQKQIDGLAQRAAALDDMTARIGKLEARPVATSGGGAVPAEIGADIDALRTEIAALGRDIAEIRGSAKTAVDAVSGAGDRLSALEAKAAQPGGGFDVATPIAAAALKGAIDRGGSFAGELETYAKVTGDSETVEKLRPFAGSGIPSGNELRADLAAVADAIIAAGSPAPQSEGLVGRLVDSARGLVRSRPVGDVSGDTPEAIVARVEDRLTKGDLEAAMTEFRLLPAEAAKAAEDFAKKLQARIEADRLIAAKVGAALATVGK